MTDPISQFLGWLWDWNSAVVGFLLPGVGLAAVIVGILIILELAFVYSIFRGLMSRLSNYAFGKVDSLILLAGSTSDEAQNIATRLRSHIPLSNPRRILQFLTGWRYSKLSIVCVDPNKRKLKTIFRQFQYQLRLGDSIHVGGKLNDAILDEDTGLAVERHLAARMKADKLVLVAGIGGAHGSSTILSKWLGGVFKDLGVTQSAFIITSDTKNQDLPEKSHNILQFKKEFEERSRGSTPLEMCDVIFVYEYDDEKESKMVRDELSDLAATIAVHGTQQFGSVKTDNLINVSLNLQSSVAYAQYLGQVSSSAALAAEGVEKQSALMDELFEKQATSSNAREVHLPPDAIGPDFSETIGGYIVADPADSDSNERMDQIKKSGSRLANNKGLTWLIFETARRQAPQVWQVYPLDTSRLKNMQFGRGLSQKSLERMCKPRPVEGAKGNRIVGAETSQSSLGEASSRP